MLLFRCSADFDGVIASAVACRSEFSNRRQFHKKVERINLKTVSLFRCRISCTLLSTKKIFSPNLLVDAVLRVPFL